MGERSFTPGPQGLHARQIAKVVLNLPAHARVEADVELDEEGGRVITGIRVDGNPISSEQWDKLRAVGLRVRPKTGHDSGEMGRVAIEKGGRGRDSMAEIQEEPPATRRE